MTKPLVTSLERLERTRELVRERAYKGQDYYVALREESGALKCGFASMEFAARTGSLLSVLYYEVWNPQGKCVKAVVVNDLKLRELGGYDLPLVERVYEQVTPEPFPTQRPAGLKAYTPPTQGANAASLWWELERAEKARKLDELVNMRRELRAMLNYD